jgi:O-antigen ligase
LHKFVYPFFVAGTTVLTLATVRLQSVVLSFFGETIDFNGRSAIWHYSWTGFLERPLIGWGWMSAWRTPPFMRRDLWWSFVNTGWSHSGYMDVLLGGGIIAAILFTGVVVWSGYRYLDSADKETAAQWTPAIMFFVLATATQESFFTGDHFLWLLFVAAVAGDLKRVNSL